jgi:hypothetical protein
MRGIPFFLYRSIIFLFKTFNSIQSSSSDVDEQDSDELDLSDSDIYSDALSSLLLLSSSLSSSLSSFWLGFLECDVFLFFRDDAILLLFRRSFTTSKICWYCSGNSLP